MKELVRQKRAAPLGGVVIDERVLGHAIVRALMVFDTKRTEIVAQRQQPVVFPIVADAAEDGALLEDDPLVRLDARLQKPEGPFAVRYDVNYMLADLGLRGPEHDAPE